MTNFHGGHGLVMAAANYRGGISPLPDAVLNDGRDMVSILTSSAHCGYAPENVIALINKDATLAAMRGALDALAARVQPGETVFIFFSGHGARLGVNANAYSALVPIDCLLGDVASTTLSEKELSAALERIAAGRMVVIIDACHSGDAAFLKKSNNDEALALGFDKKSLDRLGGGGNGRVLMASSRGNEVSLVLQGARNSLFTQFFLEALRGEAPTHGDGLIRVFEVFNYVSEKVRANVPGRQRPVCCTRVEDNFPIALCCGGDKHLFPSVSPGSVSGGWRNLEDLLVDLYPCGPQDEDLWQRAGGDLARLHLNGTGRANWFSALRRLSQGGGGSGISVLSVIRVALGDFPHHPELIRLRDSTQS